MKTKYFSNLKLLSYIFSLFFLLLLIPPKASASYSGLGTADILAIIPSDSSLNSSCPTVSDPNNIEVYGFNNDSYVQAVIDKTSLISYKTDPELSSLLVSKSATESEIGASLAGLNNTTGWSEISQALSDYTNSACADPSQVFAAQELSNKINLAIETYITTPPTTTTGTSTNTATAPTTTAVTAGGFTVSFPASAVVNTNFTVTANWDSSVNTYLTNHTQHASLFASTVEAKDLVFNDSNICPEAGKTTDCRICHSTFMSGSTGQYTATMNLTEVGDHRIYVILMNAPTTDACQQANIVAINSSGIISITAAGGNGDGDGGTNPPATPRDFSLSPSDLISLTPLTSLKGKSFPEIVQILFTSLLGYFAAGFIGLIAFIGVIVGGFQMVTAGGNMEQSKKGWKTFMWSLIGIGIAAIAYPIVTVVLNFFKGNY